MTTRLTRIQLAIFLVVTLAALVYGAVRFFDVDEVFNPPYEVNAEFSYAGGIYPRADVDLLGTRVGTVREVLPGPDSTSRVVLAIDEGVEIPTDVTARIGNKSAIGEQYVELIPRTAGGPVLADGDTIPVSRTLAPLRVEQLIGHLDALAGSIPTDDLATVLEELSTAVSGMGPDLGRLIDGTNELTRTSLENIDSLTGLIDDARIVLDTQAELGPQTTAYLSELAPLLEAFRKLNPELAGLFTDGASASAQVTGLLVDTEKSLPVLLDNLTGLNAVFAERLPSVRKTMVVFPWAVEIGATAARYCTHLNADGTGVEATCDYDAEGNPRVSGHIALQLPEAPGMAPYHPCTKGYEDTNRYRPDGAPMKGGRREAADEEPNMKAGCTASPYDPLGPNVRGSQNATSREGLYRGAPGWGLAVYDEQTELMVAPDGSTFRLTGTTGTPPPKGDAGLAWLLQQGGAQ
ncbi:MlaD family protein [Nocardioides sp. WS12]|uniref:MCE family protein n=1 Tax=Nocardioides sp. WS12 TaxID=2486272 RepID=UPI0015F9DB65|nr:MlaD family protein [Nocardioides sp. WS12]